MRFPQPVVVGGPDRSTKTGGHGPRLSFGAWECMGLGLRSTKTGGHGPRLSGLYNSHIVSASALNEDRGPWPPVMAIGTVYIEINRITMPKRLQTRENPQNQHLKLFNCQGSLEVRRILQYPRLAKFVKFRKS